MNERGSPPRSGLLRARRRHRRGRRGRDWWVLLHPPYTLWHLSYVAIGAPRRPDSTVAGWSPPCSRSSSLSVCAPTTSTSCTTARCAHDPGVAPHRHRCRGLAGAVALGVVGIARIGPGLIVFIVAGVVLTCGYNLELFGGRLHNDVTFAAAWGAFPVLTGYYAQHEQLDVAAVAAGVSRSSCRVRNVRCRRRHARFDERPPTCTARSSATMARRPTSTAPRCSARWRVRCVPSVGQPCRWQSRSVRPPATVALAGRRHAQQRRSSEVGRQA